MKKLIQDLYGIKICLSLFLILAVPFFSDSQTVQWAKRGVSPGYEYGNAIAVDDAGDAYIAGQIEYTTDFDGVSLASYGIHDILVGKYGANGSIKWLRHAGSPAGEVAYGVGVDASHNCYVTGEVERTSDFGNGFNVTSAGSNDVFLAKYNVNGTVTRLDRWGSPGNDKGRALAVSPSGECYITGYYSDGMSFGSVSLSHAGENDVFVTKISASGTVLWAKRGGGANEDRGYGVAVDKSGNVFVAGYFNSSATFSGTTISNNGFNGAYLAKYNDSGSFQWIKKGGSDDDDAEANCVAVDENGYIYSAGYYRGTATFGSTTLTSAGSTDIFLVKYDQSGNVVWAKSAGGPYEDIAYGLSIDTVNHLIYMTGQIDNSGYFGSRYVGGAGNRDVFIAAYETSGSVDWVKAYGGSNRDIGYAIAHDNSGNIFTTGIYTRSAIFQSITLSGDTISDFYIEKTSPAPAVEPTIQSSGLSVSPVNCSDLHLTFTRGNGAYRMIVARENAAVNVVPLDGSTYNANSVFGSGTNMGNGNYVVYDGTGNDLVLTGLTAGSTYYFKIFEYNGVAAQSNFFTTSAPAASSVAGTISVTINAATNELCLGDSILLTASGASTYSWSPSTGLSSTSGGSVFAFPNSGRTYTLTGTNGSGCQAQSTITITVNPNPVVSFTSPAAICENAIPVTLTGGSPAGGVYSGTGVSGNVFDPAISGAGSFAIQYTYSDINGCTASVQSGITVNSLPTITFSIINFVCENSAPFVLTNASPAGGNYSGPGVVSNSFDPSLAGAGTFQLQYDYTDINGCSNSAQSSITVNPVPVISFSGLTTTCENSLPFALNNASPSGGSYNGTGVSSGIFDPGTGAGSYLITYEYTNSSGCTAVDDFNITVNPIPVISLGPDTMICSDNSISLDAGPGFVSYQWSTGSTSQAISIDSSGVGIGTVDVFVTVSDANSCSNSDSLNITFDLCAGIGTTADNFSGVSVFPNPFDQSFNLVSEKTVSYFIYDVAGQLLEYNRSFSGEKDLGENYAPGVYFVEVIQKADKKVFRMMKVDE